MYFNFLVSCLRAYFNAIAAFKNDKIYSKYILTASLPTCDDIFQVHSNSDIHVTIPESPRLRCSDKYVV